MSERTPAPADAYVNGTLGGEPLQYPRTFPCPLCGTDLDLRQSCKQKPYCVCTDCGLQIFFRGKLGISRLRALLNDGAQRVGGPTAHAAAAVSAFSRLEQLREQKYTLEQKRGLIFTDLDLEHAIAALDHDIARVQHILDEMSSGSKS